MLYSWRSHSSALFILLTTTTTLALYVPRSKTVTTTTTTSRTTFVWSDQKQQLDPFDEDTTTLPFTCFKCPMNPKLLREIRIFAPAGEIGALSNDPTPRALLCEYDTNESPCRYDPATGMLLGDQPSGDSCARSASVSPECGPIVLRPFSRSLPSLSGGQNEPEANPSSSLAPSREESEQGRHSRDSSSSYVRKYILGAIPNSPKSESQRHFPAPDAALRYADLEDAYDALHLDPNTPPPPSPPSLDAPSTPPSPLDYDHDLDSASNEAKDDDIAPVSEITPIVSTVAPHDHESDHSSNLLFDLEFEDYSDALKVIQEAITPLYPARGPRDHRMDSVDDKAAYIMSMTTGE